MNPTVKQILKGLTGAIVIPMGVLAAEAWDWWQEVPMALKAVTGIFILPLVGLSFIISPLWEDW